MNYSNRNDPTLDTLSHLKTMRKQTSKLSSKPVRVQKYLVKLAKPWVGVEKPYSSLAKFADAAFRTELEKRGVKV